MRKARQALGLDRAFNTYLTGRPKDAVGCSSPTSRRRALRKTNDAIMTFQSLRNYPELPEPYNNLAVLYSSEGPVREGTRGAGARDSDPPQLFDSARELGDIIQVGQPGL